MAVKKLAGRPAVAHAGLIPALAIDQRDALGGQRVLACDPFEGEAVRPPRKPPDLMDRDVAEPRDQVVAEAPFAVASDGGEAGVSRVGSANLPESQPTNASW